VKSVDLTSDCGLNIVLVEPEIPPNTGNIARLALATGSRLHLVKPLGFSVDDRQIRRAGMDYWKSLDPHYWESLADLVAAPWWSERKFLFTTKATRPYWDISFRSGDYLVFGRETKGLPEAILNQNPDDCFTIPMRPKARSLNLATAVAIVLFEAVRQTAARP
jgi:tRNA (cytidine/uridine-2'-O-)-methyltransferase